MLIRQRPFTGWGLGQTITYYEVGFKEFVDTYLTHNIITDLLLRTGFVGLFLFVCAAAGSFFQGVTAWRYASDPMVAATALASVTIMSGWLAHGMVESLFEHVQLAPLFGIMIGLVQAAVSQVQRAGGGHRTHARPRRGDYLRSALWASTKSSSGLSVTSQE